MNPLKLFTMPQYFFRPRQILRRAKQAFSARPPEFGEVQLPWGDRITIRPRETIGALIWYYGVFDLVVTEAICRLLDEAEIALDIGANIGQMTSLMRYQTGRKGRVISVEPHPELFADLTRLVGQPALTPNVAPVETHQVALSDKEGEAFLDVGPNWEENRGLSKVVPEADGKTARTLRVRLTTLDKLLHGTEKVGLCKIDVEGHELNVFQGAARLLKERRLRDIVFEDFGKYPTDVHRMFLDHGFSLFSLHSSLLKPLLRPVSSAPSRFEAHDGENYLATLEPDRARERFQPLGWRVLGRSLPRGAHAG